jgi:hypothetical protein
VEYTNLKLETSNICTGLARRLKTSGGEVSIRVFSLLGNNLFTKKYQVVSGNNNFGIQLDIPNGVYQVVFDDNNGNIVIRKIVKTNN